MKRSLLYIFLIAASAVLSSCENNLNSPAVNPEIKANSKVLVELFSSITCVNCAQASIFCDNISALMGITANDTNVLVINYHPSFFPTDPFYQFNKELNLEREEYYGIYFIPTGHSGGELLTSPFSASQWTNQINANLAEYKVTAMVLENSIDSINRSGQILIQAEMIENYEYDNPRLYLIVTENNLYANSPSGKYYYFNIARQMLNQSGGKPIQILPGQTTSLIINYVINPGIIIQNSAIVVFIQDYNSKKIIAADKIKFY